ncbi:hypothetical protein [Chryseosolibacter indicus]|uniref:DUF3784 domain-containing protein n=1 Tax=Chryseosolibacter indicus TaxID=2782351 RepID=A0ABS5VVV6_9BACT|nr:hypothetical protein [Chryseosolibacter indicus]MBT1705471.1 hypothetical protein [Chryseosolibacter indicus]
MTTFFEVLMPFSIIGTFGTTVYFFTKVITDYMLRKKMIDKGYVGEEAQSIFKTYASSSPNRYASLKWGLLFFTGGISLIIIDLIEVRPDSPLPYGVFTVSVSLGFLIYYFLVRKELK